MKFLNTGRLLKDIILASLTIPMEAVVGLQYFIRYTVYEWFVDLFTNSKDDKPNKLEIKTHPAWDNSDDDSD